MYFTFFIKLWLLYLKVKSIMPIFMWAIYMLKRRKVKISQVFEILHLQSSFGNLPNLANTNSMRLPKYFVLYEFRVN